MEGFVNSGKVARGFLGIDPQDIDANLAKGFGAPNADGALIAEVTPDSPAAKAGLMAGDVIVDINGKDISSADNLRVTVSQLAPGSEAKVKIYRAGIAKTVSVTLAERPDASRTPAKPDTTNAPPAKADALDGVEVQDLTSHLRWQLGADASVSGALITGVDRTSNSFDAGLRAGDVILEINHQPVANAQDSVRLCKAATGDQILVKIWEPARSGARIRFLDVDNTRRTN
jgi:serine protease Do